MGTALIACGGNLGDVPATLLQAYELLSRIPACTGLKHSRLYRTRPIGPAAGEGFFNSAVILSTGLAPEVLLQELQRIEHELGRVRSVHWGPRAIDLDLIGLDDLVRNDPQLQLPHPACWYRRFVLDPLQEIVPCWRHPLLEQTVDDLRNRLLVRPLPIGLSRSLHSVHSRLIDRFGSLIDLAWLPEVDAVRTLYSMSVGGYENRFQVTLNAGPGADGLPEQSVFAILEAALDQPLRLD